MVNLDEGVSKQIICFLVISIEHFGWLASGRKVSEAKRRKKEECC
jgi:hypothetical protein